MNLNNLFNQSEELDLDNLDFSDMDALDVEDYDELMYNPTNVTIEPDDWVDVVQDGSILHSGEWQEVQKWFDENWTSLSGTINLAHNGMVLHSFQVSHNS